jgi:hypothetical protein
VSTEAVSAEVASTDAMHVARERLARLAEAGALGFDALGFAQLRGLIERGEALGEGARTRLLPRIEARLARLEQSFASARAGAEAALASLEAEGGVEAPLRAALARGDFQAVVRGVNQRVHARTSGQQLVPIGWIPRLQAQAAARGLRLDDALARGLGELDHTPGFVARRSLARASSLGNALSIRLFRDSVESARAVFSMARASDNVPEAAGPYNGQALSARALAAIAELSPAYLRAFLAGLDDLETVALAIEPEGKKLKATKRKRGAATG